MTTGAKVGLGLGAVAAISIIYFGFTDKGKQKWASLMGPKGTDASGNSIGRPNTAEDAQAGTRLGADGADGIPKGPGWGNGRGSSGADGYYVKGKGGEFMGTVVSKTKKDKPNQKIEDLKKQGLVTF